MGQIRTAFEGAAAKAKLADFRFHNLRHTAASHLVMRGASLADVKEVLGRSDLKMTLRYAHLNRAPAQGGQPAGRADAGADRRPEAAAMAQGMAQSARIGRLASRKSGSRMTACRDSGGPR